MKRIALSNVYIDILNNCCEEQTHQYRIIPLMKHKLFSFSTNCDYDLHYTLVDMLGVLTIFCSTLAFKRFGFSE